ncbi:hypothetical protein COCOBI_06-3090 [Coccomyxa sp. Obi]|nr:hypothetical protein COCOBI_06-3090 [Coccomyxa sp. Obi]
MQNCITFGHDTGGLAKTADSVSSSGRTPLLPLRASQTVGSWLNALNMGSFADAFEKEKVDMRALPLLSEADMIYLGVTSASQRRNLLTAAKALQQQPAGPASAQTSTSQPQAQLPAPQGLQNEEKSRNGVRLPPARQPQAKEHERSSHSCGDQTDPVKQSRSCTVGRAASLSDVSTSRGSRLQPRIVQKLLHAPSAAQELSKPKGAQRLAAKSLKEQEQAASMEAVHVLDSIVPDSEEDSDFADDRIAARLLPFRKKAKSSAGRLSKQMPSGVRSTQAQTALPASVEEERDQLERALALSLSASRETRSHESQPPLLSSSDVPDAAQHVSANQLPSCLSGALSRVLAARSSRGRVSQNRSYSRQTEQRLLETLYPPSRHAGSDRLQQAALEGHQSDEDRPATDRSGWSSEEDEGMGKASSNVRVGNVRETSSFPAFLSKSSIGKSGSVERVPAERSLWAMARQSDGGACPAASLQERFAARKAADLAQQAALASTKSKGQAALRVQALKEELAAAQATVLELKTYLADAERELLQEQQQTLE